ncbi:hypothetical protein PC9H_008717 [Pleurotus ostreatus]|uniref:Uncharacterized protein n=1 Tax=Pleurotus ostreatus TaxID=5322 RepID=A0A8H6ZRU1_PLEOS|nr:uncharacterized protein PC9H_008717 [Pleurotus ostreatus]KAF7426349.1 hypothetical protein PC9H_008717 [Pleurotus ostreatus]
MWKHFLHPQSPLSNTYWVKRAFFCDTKPDSEFDAFAKNMSHYESLQPDIRLTTFRTSTSLPASSQAADGSRQLRGAAEHYRGSVVDLIKAKKLDSESSGLLGDDNDLQWDDGVREAVEFYEQL